MAILHAGFCHCKADQFSVQLYCYESFTNYELFCNYCQIWNWLYFIIINRWLTSERHQVIHFLLYFTIFVVFCRYNKTEDLLPGGEEMLQFSHVMLGVSNSSATELQPYHETHSIFHIVEAFSRLHLSLWSWPPAEIVTEPRIYLLKRKLTKLGVWIFRRYCSWLL